MEKAQIQQYRWKLESRREDALRLLDRLASETRALDVDSLQDPGDQSTDSLAKESLFRQTSQRRHMVRMIERALRRIADGTYGICFACAGDIPRKRLEALPWTDWCLRCQEIAERELESEPSPQASRMDIQWKRAGGFIDQCAEIALPSLREQWGLGERYSLNSDTENEVASFNAGPKTSP